jgi:hypothetical protein
MTSIRRWVAWAEQKIAGVVIAEGLDCGLCEVKQGPLTITFRVRLLKPTPASLKKMLALAPTLAQVLQVEGVRIVDTARGVLIEIESPAPQTPHGLHLARYTQGFCVALGFDQWRTPAVVDLKQHPTVLFVGPTRKGKTSGMKSAVFALAQANPPEQLRFVVLSQKRYDWTAFENAKACLGVVSDPDEAVAVMVWGAKWLLQQRAKHGRPGTAVLFVIDDLVNLLKRAPGIAHPMGEIASMGGGVHLFQFISTQHAGSKAGTGGSDIEDNITARVVYKPSSASSGARSAGLGGLGLDSLSAHKGDCLLIVDGYAKRIATAHTEDAQIFQLSQGNEVVTPWRSSRDTEESITDNDVPVTGFTSSNQPDPPAIIPNRMIRDDRDGNVGITSPAPVTAVTSLFPITKRPMTTEEAQAARALRAKGESLNSLCRTVYGGKNDKILQWVKEALAEKAGDEEKPNTEALPAVLDLTTKTERATLQKLQVSGLITWPDPSTLVAETE